MMRPDQPPVTVIHFEHQLMARLNRLRDLAGHDDTLQTIGKALACYEELVHEELAHGELILRVKGQEDRVIHLE